MKRIIFLLITAGCLAGHAVAFEFGVDISDTTGLNGTNKVTNVVQTNALDAFFTMPTGDFSSVYLSAQLRFFALFPVKPKAKAQLIPIAQMFRLTRSDWSGYKELSGMGLQWAVGRTPFSDYSAKILNGLFDGGRVKLTVKYADIAFAAGYTGLTYKNDAKIGIDEDDIALMNKNAAVLAPHRAFFLISSSFQELIPSHTFGFDALAQFDLLKQKKATHTQYFIPHIHGRIGRNVSWKYWGAVLFGQDPKLFYSLASGLSVRYFNPNWRYFTVTGMLNWAAGDYDGTGLMRAFIPVTDQKHTVVANIPASQFSNMLTAGLTASVRPIQELLTEMSYTMLSSPNTEKIQPYVGSELTAKAAYHFHNDLDASFTGGVFVPNKEVIKVYNFRWLMEFAFTVHL